MKRDIRCPKCSKKLCEVEGDAVIDAVCPRCKNRYKVKVCDTKIYAGRSATK